VDKKRKKSKKKKKEKKQNNSGLATGDGSTSIRKEEKRSLPLQKKERKGSFKWQRKAMTNKATHRNIENMRGCSKLPVF